MSAVRKRAQKPALYGRLRDAFGDRSFGETLDAAVMARFPGVECDTCLSIFSMNMVSRWWVAGTEDTKLSPAKARQVREFVAGFRAAYDALVVQP